MSKRFAVVLCFVLCCPNSVFAHHSITVHYDLRQITEITGKVVSVRWRNPHTLIFFETQNDNGETERWKAEAGSINTLKRNGFSQDILSRGATITFIGAVSRAGRKEMLAAKGVSAGKEYLLFPAIANAVMPPANPPPPEIIISAAGYEIPISKAPDIFRVWAPIKFPATGIVKPDLPLTETARVAADGYDRVSGDLANQCIAAGMPAILDQPYPVEFVDEGDRILLRFEEWDATRIVHMEDVDHEEGAGTIYGHSRGHWDGDTLVIETRGTGYPYYDDAGTPSSPDMITTERYTISEDRTRLDWSATTTDPNVFTAPVTLGGWMAWAPNLEIRKFGCLLE